MAEQWDVAVIGGGPAGLAAAHAAAAAGAGTVVLERAEHPRYKTCGGGLIGTSAAIAARLAQVPARDEIRTITVTLDGRREFSHAEDRPLLQMVVRDEFDDTLRRAAASAGAVIRPRCQVRAVSEEDGQPRARLADGSTLSARVIVGADGSSGVTARYAGVRWCQTDLGLELEIPVPEKLSARWRGRVLLDWGPVPGSYGWVFPKGGQLTVGVIAARGQGERTRRYLRDFVARLGLAGYPPDRDSGHLTRCRSEDSPLRRGRVIVAGDAAGLLEPWTREGISFALRSGELAGAAAATAAASTGAAGQALAGYEAAVRRSLAREMNAGRRLLAGFERHPGTFHTVLGSDRGWRSFARFCRGEATFEPLAGDRRVRIALAVLSRA